MTAVTTAAIRKLTTRRGPVKKAIRAAKRMVALRIAEMVRYGRVTDGRPQMRTINQPHTSPIAVTPIRSIKFALLEANDTEDRIA